MGRPRVLHLFNSFQQGGTEQQTVQLVRQLRMADVEVHVACQRRDGPLVHQLGDLDADRIAAFPLARLYDAQAVKQVRRFARHLRELRIDVLHTHDFYTNTFGLLAGALAGTPVRIGSKRELGMLTWPQTVVERLAFRFATCVIANCNVARDQLARAGVRPDKVVTIHNGVARARAAVDATQDREESLCALGLGAVADRRIIVMVGNFRHALKDHPTLLRAAGQVLSRFPNCAFVLAGEGARLAQMRALSVDLGIDGAVHFIGRCDRIADLLHGADICVLSSLSEAFPNVVLEYMAAGRPVVATRVGGVPEAVVDGVHGYLVAPGDPPAMAERILRLLDDPGLGRRMGQSGRLRANAEFSSEQQWIRTSELYSRLLAHRDSSTVWRTGCGEADVPVRAPAHQGGTLLPAALDATGRPRGILVQTGVPSLTREGDG